MILTVVDVESGDWAGFYLDGVMGSEGHTIRYDELLDCIQKEGKPIDSWTNYTVSDEWIENNGFSLPKLLSEIPESELKR